MASAARRVTITPAHPCFGARVEGVDLAQPLDDSTFHAIFEAFQEYSVLVFHDQQLTDGQQVAFSERFGPLETTIKAIGREDRLHPKLVDLSNLDPESEGQLLDWTDRRMVYQSGNQLWHSDSSFKPVPAMASLLSAREVPPVGGETEFASMRHAYATLPEETVRRREGQVVVHSILYSRSTIAKGLFDPDRETELPPVRQALVRTNPTNGRKSIFVGSHAWYVEGMPYGESRRLLDDLLAHSTRSDSVYQHRWRQWDLVMWDNRCVLHRGRPWDAGRYRRVMRRTTVAGEGPYGGPAVRPAHPRMGGDHPGRRGRLAQLRAGAFDLDRMSRCFADAATAGERLGEPPGWRSGCDLSDDIGRGSGSRPSASRAGPRLSDGDRPRAAGSVAVPRDDRDIGAYAVGVPDRRGRHTYWRRREGARRMGTVIVRGGAAGFGQEVFVGRHRLTADEPEPEGTDTGPSPYDFLLVALGS